METTTSRHLESRMRAGLRLEDVRLYLVGCEAVNGASFSHVEVAHLQTRFEDLRLRN